MLNVEIKKNGQMIGFMNIHREDEYPDGINRYSYHLVKMQETKRFTNILHAYDDGFESLVIKCLQHAQEAI